jgi:hypothetical protein
MKVEFTKQDWITNKFNNETLIKTNLMQIQMAKEIIKLCEKEIKKFPMEETEETNEEEISDEEIVED